MAFIYLQRNYSPLGAHAAPRQPHKILTVVRNVLGIGTCSAACIRCALWDIWQRLDGARIVCKVRRPFLLFRYDWHRARTLALDIDDLRLEIRKTQKLFAAICNEIGSPRSGEPIIRLVDTETGKYREAAKRPSPAGKPAGDVVRIQDAKAATAAPKPRRDPDAPFGRDEAGKPIAKFGYKRDGSIRRTKPRLNRQLKQTVSPERRAELDDLVGKIRDWADGDPQKIGAVIDHLSKRRPLWRRVADWLRALPRRRAVRRARLAESVLRHPSGAAA